MATQSAPTNWKEARRLRAFELKQAGWTQQEIVKALGISKGAVSQWMKAAEAGGREALRSRPRPGRPERLNSEKRKRLPGLLARGAGAFGFRGEVWTCRRVAKVIRDEFGVRYSKAHISRILQDIGWTPQQPIQRASQRNEVAIENWREYVWPRLKKGLSEKGKRLFL